MRLRLAIAFSLLACGLAIARAALPANLWEADMQRFDMLDREHPMPQGGVVFVGSSSIRLWDLKKSFPQLDAPNRGFGGSELADSVKYLDRLVLRHKPRVVVLYAGDNDIGRGKSPEQVMKDFEEFVAGVHKEFPETKILYIAIKPSILRWNLAEPMQRTNAGIAAICAESNNCEFVNVWPAMMGADGRPKRDLFAWDGLHMNDAGYRFWAKLIEDKVK
jgi:lysophospholipase L1-like esterase